MTADLVYKEFQRMVGDTFGQTWTWEAVKAYLNDAMRQLASDRPESLLDSDGALQAIADVTRLDDTLVFEQRFSTALASWMAFRALSEDDADRANEAKAARALATYRMIVGGRG